MVYKILNKNTLSGAATRTWWKTLDTHDKSDIENKTTNVKKKQLAEELHKPIIRNLKTDKYINLRQYLRL